MPYICNLGDGRQIYLANQGTQTVVSLVSMSAGQQQSQSHSFVTGLWTMPPTVLRTNTSLTIRIETAQGQSFIQVQGNSIQTQVEVPLLANADILPLQHVDQSDTQKGDIGFKPMTPMTPMRMGNMEMQMNPMHMRMGDMEMQMPDQRPATSSQQPVGKKFCSNCGAKVQAGDRFCSSCGHQL